MRILLDECVDSRLARMLTGHEVKTVPQCGWSGIQNGKLLKLAETEFEVFLTFDQNMAYQQPIAKFQLVYLAVKAHIENKEDLQGVAVKILSALPDADKGRVTIVE